MERNIKVTLEKAREWYNSNNKTFKELALQAFNQKELQSDFKSIKSLYDACNTLNLDFNEIICTSSHIAKISKASAAMFKLNIIKKALNLGQDLYLIKDPEDSYIYFPYNPFVTEDSIYYNSELNSDEMTVIGKIKSEGTLYNVLGGDANPGCFKGLSDFRFYNGVSLASANIGFLGCASKEIAKHFGKYFGMLITEAKYGDIVDFEIIESKY